MRNGGAKYCTMVSEVCSVATLVSDKFAAGFIGIGEAKWSSDQFGGPSLCGVNMLDGDTLLGWSLSRLRR